MQEISNDHDAVSNATRTARNGLPDFTVTNVAGSSGISAAVGSAVDDGNRRTKEEIDGAGRDADNTEKASEDIAEADRQGGKRADDIDTELSASHGGNGGPATRLGSPMGSGTPMAAPQASPMPPSMPPMQMPQAPAPTGNYTMPASMMSNLMNNFDPSKASSAGKDSLMSANGIKEGKIPPSSVMMQKTGIGPLSKSQMHATIEKALDLNGISKDPKVRAQWERVLTFMAQKESSFNPDAVNLHDTNARGARAMDGHPGQCSRGIWQTIPTTFAANHVSGTSSNIYDPVASGAAAVRYIMGKYDVSPEGGASLNKFYANRMAGGYTGY